jgi:hypothetical protein
LRYSFGIFNWRTEEIKEIDRKTIKMLTMYKMHHPKPDIDRLYVKRKEGEDWCKSKRHIKQKQLILPNTLT